MAGNTENPGSLWRIGVAIFTPLYAYLRHMRVNDLIQTAPTKLANNLFYEMLIKDLIKPI
jgi:hypothetical protein